MSKKIIFGLLLTLFLLLPTAYAGFNCKNTILNENNNIVYCEYTATKKELFSPKVEGDLKYILDYPEKVMEKDQVYLLKIIVDIYNNSESKYNLKLIQSDYSQNVNIMINRLYPDIESNYNINYNNNLANVNIVFENKTSTNYPIIVRFNDINNILNKKIDDQIIILKGLESKNLNLELDLKNSGKLNYEILFANKKINNFIDLNTSINEEEKPKYNLVAFFGLSNLELSSNTLFLILNIFLFVIAIVLFTMFIGRLGKVIVKR
jgi:hypothetical protein